MFGNPFKKRGDDGAARVERAIAEYRAQVIEAAERKLGRTLSSDERRGIESLSSLMMLESCDRSFSAEQTTAAQVEKDVAYFASQAKTAEKAF
jgi:hypothetical protein